MASTAAEARQDLELVLRQGIKLPQVVRPLPVANRAQRNSAVLILFGALDRVPASEFTPAKSVPPELDVLLTRRANGLRNHAGQIAFPGGGVEAEDLDRAATALREANEETDLNPSGVDILGTLTEAHIPISNYLVTPVLGWWRLPSKVAADHSESVEVFRVPVAEMLSSEARGTWVFPHAESAHRGPAFQLGTQFGGHLVWGFTAMLLSAIFEAAGWAEPWNENRTFEVAR